MKGNEVEKESEVSSRHIYKLFMLINSPFRLSLWINAHIPGQCIGGGIS